MTIVTDNHPGADELLLFAYGELPPPGAADVQAHVAGCAACHAQLADMDRARVAAEWALARPPRRMARWAAGALAAAAVLAAILLTVRRSSDQVPNGWPAQLEWSVTAGYIAGGRPMIAIDSQLTRLEKELPYARP
ncbi:MAG TPA: zf-HC2 domain-containing protein [Gemmatimonadales bacterium]|nr:zf-HC2 domain-containing protein [Gemmatimonadales bacterium]